MLQNQSVILFALEENVTNFVYDINAIDHCLSHRIQLYHVRHHAHMLNNDKITLLMAIPSSRSIPAPSLVGLRSLKSGSNDFKLSIVLLIWASRACKSLL